MTIENPTTPVDKLSVNAEIRYGNVAAGAAAGTTILGVIGTGLGAGIGAVAAGLVSGGLGAGAGALLGAQIGAGIGGVAGLPTGAAAAWDKKISTSLYASDVNTIAKTCISFMWVLSYHGYGGGEKIDNAQVQELVEITENYLNKMTKDYSQQKAIYWSIASRDEMVNWCTQFFSQLEAVSL